MNQPTVKTEGAVELVRYGYDEPTRCLTFQAAFYDDLTGVLEAVRAIEAYNDFDAERVCDALLSVADDLGPDLAVGREYSPVLYLKAKDGRAFDRIADAMRGALADEVDPGGRDGLTVRAWWD